MKGLHYSSYARIHSTVIEYGKIPVQYSIANMIFFKNGALTKFLKTKRKMRTRTNLDVSKHVRIIIF